MSNPKLTRRTKSDSELPSPSRPNIKFTDESYHTPKTSRTIIRDVKLVKRKFHNYTVSKRRRCQMKPRVLFPVNQDEVKDEIEDLANKVLHKKVAFIEDDQWLIEKISHDDEQHEEKDLNLQEELTFSLLEEDDDIESPEISSITETCSEP